MQHRSMAKSLSATLFAGALLSSLAIVAMTVPETAAAGPPSPKVCLDKAANGGAPLPAIVYSDMHGLWGGSTLALAPDGAYRRDTVDPRGPAERAEVAVDPARHRALAALLIELKAWKQRVPERPAVPDESRATLTIRCGGAEARIWEWYNDLGKHRRIARVVEALRALERQGG
jgi:hypothetical protein